uniref:Copper chaperone for superoxide dismutase n=1 Tax=Bos mutus grunniens TaxID=30521 RepID=A0A8B9YI94_BOSMU
MASDSEDRGTACTLEFAVQMTCQSCVDAVRTSLQGIAGIQSVEVQLENQMVLVQTTLPSQEVQALLEGTGRQAVLKGMGSGLLPVGTTLTLMECPMGPQDSERVSVDLGLGENRGLRGRAGSSWSLSVIPFGESFSLTLSCWVRNIYRHFLCSRPDPSHSLARETLRTLWLQHSQNIFAGASGRPWEPRASSRSSPKGTGCGRASQRR